MAALPALALTLAAAPAPAADKTRDLTEVSLEELMNIQVTTVARKEQRLAQSPAAVYVITQEDIRRSGMTALPDLLRMAPGLQVGQMQAGGWGVSARGFNSQSSDKMLVLIDGRSIHSPIDKGVFWDEHDILLEDIDRIEVIRGPGATMWGANAVNGVINIITKPAAATQGSLITADAGSAGRAGAALRFGGAIGDRFQYRIFSKYTAGQDLYVANSGVDGLNSLTTGLRADWTLSAKDSLTVEGNLFHASSGVTVKLFQLTPPFVSNVNASNHSDGGDVLVSWSEVQSSRSRTQLRIYADNSRRSDVLQSESNTTVDLDFQHEFALSDSHDLVWGFGFRESLSGRSIGFNAAGLPPYRDESLVSAFLQDQWKISTDLSLILGSKIEHSNFSGFTGEPAARLLWTPNSRTAGWAAVSRAVRTPSYADQSLRFNLGVSPSPQGIPVLVTAFGSPAERSETLLSYELGGRMRFARRLSADVASFYSRYRHLETVEPGASYLSLDPAPPHVVMPLTLLNGMHGESWGGEINAHIDLLSHWRLIPGYSYLRLSLHEDPTSHDTQALALSTQSPRNQFQIRSNIDLSRRWQFDAAAYSNASLAGYNIPAYTRLDARLGYRPRPEFELSLVAQNLQGGRHQELISLGPYSSPATIGRSVFAKLTWGVGAP